MPHSSYRKIIASLILCCAGSLMAQTPLTERERALLDRIERLEKRVAALEGKPTTAPETSRSSVLGGATTGAATAAAAPGTTPAEDQKSPILGFVPGTTLNFYFDGYYGYNFNRPVGRVNLVRANDVLSNNLTLNQVGLILERAPDVAAGRRFGGRLDLMFGQNTETLQGGTQNEPRPQVYRPVFPNSTALWELRTITLTTKSIIPDRTISIISRSITWVSAQRTT